MRHHWKRAPVPFPLPRLSLGGFARLTERNNTRASRILRLQLISNSNLARPPSRHGGTVVALYDYLTRATPLGTMLRANIHKIHETGSKSTRLVETRRLLLLAEL